MSSKVTVKISSTDARVLDETTTHIVVAIRKVSGSDAENVTTISVEPKNAGKEQVRSLTIWNLNDKLVPALTRMDVPHLVNIKVREAE